MQPRNSTKLQFHRQGRCENISLIHCETKKLGAQQCYHEKYVNGEDDVEMKQMQSINANQNWCKIAWVRSRTNSAAGQTREIAWKRCCIAFFRNFIPLNRYLAAVHFSCSLFFVLLRFFFLGLTLPIGKAIAIFVWCIGRITFYSTPELIQFNEKTKKTKISADEEHTQCECSFTVIYCCPIGFTSKSNKLIWLKLYIKIDIFRHPSSPVVSGGLQTTCSAHISMNWTINESDAMIMMMENELTFLYHWKICYQNKTIKSHVDVFLHENRKILLETENKVRQLKKTRCVNKWNVILKLK